MLSISGFRGREMDGLFKMLAIVYIIVVVLFLSIYFFASSDKRQYKRYKNYEVSINTKQQIIIDNANKDLVTFQANKISKRQMINSYEKASKDLKKLYSSFKWKKGDIITNELYMIKRQIVLNYSQIFYFKSKALHDNIPYSDLEDTNYINVLLDRYSKKDKIQRDKFKVSEIIKITNPQIFVWGFVILI